MYVVLLLYRKIVLVHRSEMLYFYISFHLFIVNFTIKHLLHHNNKYSHAFNGFLRLIMIHISLNAATSVTLSGNCPKVCAVIPRRLACHLAFECGRSEQL